LQQSFSKVDYTIKFAYDLNEDEFISTAKSVDFLIERDELEVLPSDPSSLFPSIGETVTGKVEMLSHNLMCSIYPDGIIIDCSRIN
jgi:hypothetical protein